MLSILSPAPALAQSNQANGAESAVMIGLILPPTNGADPLQAAVARSMHEGAVMANEELGQNAKLLGMPFTVVTKTAADSTAAVTAAKQLIAQGAVTLVAGLEDAETEAVARVADKAKVPLLNVLAETDNLRNQACSPYLFDIAPSAAMYLDALEGWFVGQGLRKWEFVVSNDKVGTSMLARARATLTGKHFAARVAGVVRVKPGAPVDSATLQAIKKDAPDVVVLLLSANDQLTFVKAYAASGMKALITGFPYPDAQTRTFFKAWHETSGSAEAGYRSEAWDAKLPSFGAVQLNSRFEKRWNKPMDTASWGAFMAFQVLYNTLTSGGARTRAAIQTYFEQPNTVFDVWKGVGVSFRPWNHQLRQVLYLVHIEKDGSVSLVGTLPEVFKPGTSLLERLDQIGYSKSASQCHL
ncbi:MAG: ABC transporter substrate-binding protein [Deinococcales bacterium]